MRRTGLVWGGSVSQSSGDRREHRSKQYPVKAEYDVEKVLAEQRASQVGVDCHGRVSRKSASEELNISRTW